MKSPALPCLPVLLLAALLLPSLSGARPVRAVLVVQNHANDDFAKPLSGIGSLLRAKLAGSRFAVIDPGDRVGTGQNRGTGGEPLPPSSAVNLALASEGELLLTASIDEASVDVIGASGPRQRKFAQMTLTLSAVQLPLGEVVAAETFTAKSDSVPGDMLDSRAGALYSQTVQRLVAGAAKKFLAVCEEEDRWSAVTVPEYITVGFGCNVPGANVLLDGLSRGTAGGPGSGMLPVRTWRGIHHVTITGDFMRPFDTEAMLEGGTSFVAVLRENEEGRRVRKEDRMFDLLMDRIAKSGATDDDVRILKAEGYAKYLSGSYTRIQGMPQVLTARDFNPDLGLGGVARDETGEATAAYVRQLGTALGLPVDDPKAPRGDAGRPGEEGGHGGASRPGAEGEKPVEEGEAPSLPRPLREGQVAIASAPASPAPAFSPAASPAPASPAPTVAETLDTLNSGASIAKSILHIWNLAH